MKQKIQLSDHFGYSRLVRFTIPSILMMIFTSIYGVVDGFFVSNFVGKTSFAAVNFIMPFLMVVGAMGFMFGTGGSALMAKTMGEGKKEKAQEIFSLIIYVVIICSLIISVISIIFLRRIAIFLGAEGEMLENCVTYGRIMYVNFIFLAVFIGYATGVAPVISYHYGAGNTKELKNLLKRSVIMILLASGVMLFLSESLAKPLAGIFVGYDQTLLKMTVHAFSIYAISFLFSGISIFGSSFFTALGDGLTSAIISFLRTLLFESGAVLLLPLILGLDGIWSAIIVAEFMAVTVTVVFLVAKRKKYKYF